MNGLFASITICAMLIFCNLSGLINKRNADNTAGPKVPEAAENRSTEKPDKEDQTNLKNNNKSDPIREEEKQKVSVSIRIITQGASGCGFYSEELLKLKTQGQTFSATTNMKGVATFKNVPCGSIGEITSNIELITGGGTLTLKRNIDCSKTVNYWGSYGDVSGGKSQIPEKEANSCYEEQ